MPVCTLQNHCLPHRLGTESGRRWASINVAIVLSVGYQANCIADQIAAASASAGAAGAGSKEEKFVDPPTLLMVLRQATAQTPRRRPEQ